MKKLLSHNTLAAAAWLMACASAFLLGVDFQREQTKRIENTAPHHFVKLDSGALLHFQGNRLIGVEHTFKDGETLRIRDASIHTARRVN